MTSINENTPYQALVTLEVIEREKIQETLNQLATLKKETLKESGCIRFDFFQNAEQPWEIFLLEIFENQSAFDLHIKASYTQAYFKMNLTNLLNSHSIAKII